jgi:hypothetical protein
MVGSFTGCCARAASGQAIAAPPMSVMNSRRLNRSNCICAAPAKHFVTAYLVGEDQVSLRCGMLGLGP